VHLLDSVPFWLPRRIHWYHPAMLTLTRHLSQNLPCLVIPTILPLLNPEFEISFVYRPSNPDAAEKMSFCSYLICPLPPGRTRHISRSPDYALRGDIRYDTKVFSLLQKEILPGCVVCLPCRTITTGHPQRREKEKSLIYICVEPEVARYQR
jgi:hypothetical protein